MKAGTKVNVYGVRSSTRVACSDEACGLDHFERDEVRYHREDGPRTAELGYVVIPMVEKLNDDGEKVLVENPEPEGRLSVFVDGTVLSVDEADVEAVA
jgi:hypothetical protein